jgi:uncharacterized protein
MNATLAWTALLMGLAGGPHCLAMCGLGCAGVARATGGQNRHATKLFHMGRVAGYTMLGAVAGASTEGLGWLAAQTSVLRPIWTTLMLATFAFGLWMLASARQPVWLELAGRSVWGKVKGFTQVKIGGQGGVAPMMMGGLWALMPCSLLYSALLVAMLSGNAWNGATTMLLFGTGSTLVMTGGTAVALRFLRGSSQVRLQLWSIRLAGLALVAASVWALWMGANSSTGFWCFAQ